MARHRRHQLDGHRQHRRFGRRRRAAAIVSTLALAAALVVVVWPSTGPNRTSPPPTSSVAGTGRNGGGRPASGPHQTLFGAAVYRNPGESFAQALRREDDQFGRLGILRLYFSGLPPPWQQSKLAGAKRPVIVSFKAPAQTVLSGADDAGLRAWFRSVPRRYPVYWCYFHEPENNIASGEFTAAQYRAAWAHIAAIARSVHNPYLHPTLILMNWTLNPRSGRNWREYFPGKSVVQYIGWDAYNPKALSQHGGYEAPSVMFRRIVRLMRSLRMPWGIAEVGSLLAAGDSGAGRAAWLQLVASYVRGAGAAWCSYFDADVGGVYELSDAPSIQSWRKAITGKGAPAG